MTCPICKVNFKKAVFYGVEIDYCPQCLGLWFEEDELREAKDEKDMNLNWLDISLWQDKKKLKISKNERICPACSVPLYSVNYGNSPLRQAQGDAEPVEASNLEVDICNVCRGIWLDRGEFRKIIEYLKTRGKEEILRNYFKNLIEEGIEVFTGPETFREELADFLTILKLLNYKFATQYPTISKVISILPK